MDDKAAPSNRKGNARLTREQLMRIGSRMRPPLGDIDFGPVPQHILDILKKFENPEDEPPA